MIVIAGLFIGLLGSAILGAIVLAVVPRFELTVRNLLIFVIGAFLGMFGFTNFVERILYRLGMLGPMSIERENNLAYALALAGALIGGTLLVWLKTRLGQKTNQKKT